jgi:hypothetical protein
VRCAPVTTSSAASCRGFVVALHHRARGSSARVRIGDVHVHALIDSTNAPRVGDTVDLQLDPRALVLFAD